MKIYKRQPQIEYDDSPVSDEEQHDDDFIDNELDEDFDMGGGAVAPIRQLSDLLSKLTNFEPYLKSQIMEWLGMYWDESKKEFVRDTNVKPIMNIHGARWCINYLRTYTRDNNIITTLDADTYQFIIEDIINAVWLNIGTRAKEFGITEEGDILAVANQLIHSSQLVLVGAGGSKTYTDFLGTATSRSEIVHNQQMPQQQQFGNPPMSYGRTSNKGIIDRAKTYLGM